ncbi:MAG: hypothetical protein Q8P20_05515, partial [bacterium]|nr:hypothetical protein [bacterium]
HRDGINTVNYIVLGDASNGSGKIVVIMNSCDETCDHNHTGEVASITEWFNSQNWSTYYSTTDSKQTEIVIRTADTELINAIRSGKDSVGNNNSEVIVKKVSLKSGVFDDIKDPGVDTNDIDSADFIEIEISTK